MILVLTDRSLNALLCCYVTLNRATAGFARRPLGILYVRRLSATKSRVSFRIADILTRRRGLYVATYFQSRTKRT